MRAMFRRRCLCLFAGAVVLSSAVAGFGADGAHSSAAAVLDLHTVNWATVTLPASACGASRPIQLHRPSWALTRTEGAAFFTPIPRRWAHAEFYGKQGVTVESGWDPVAFGDLNGNGTDDAGLVYNCNNGGGTADGVLLEGWVIFSGRGGKPSVVGIVTPRVQPPNVLPTLVEITIKPGRITAHEFFYGANDGTCCASGRATTIWTYANGILRPGVPVITRRPNTSPRL